MSAEQVAAVARLIREDGAFFSDQDRRVMAAVADLLDAVAGAPDFDPGGKQLDALVGAIATAYLEEGQ